MAVCRWTNPRSTIIRRIFVVAAISGDVHRQTFAWSSPMAGRLVVIRPDDLAVLRA